MFFYFTGIPVDCYDWMLLTEALTAQGWYDQNWQYRRPVTIANPGGTALTNYQVMITLNSSSSSVFHKCNK